MISNRLKTIASFIDKSDSVVDIGTDHGFLAIYLHKNALCKNICASDINVNALKNAQNNITAHKLTKQIPTVLSDGFASVDVELYNTAIIAGMGTSTICKILDNKKSLRIEKFIIQTNNEHARLRTYMNKLGYYLNAEKVLQDRRKFYIIMQFIRANKNNTKEELLFGLPSIEHKTYYLEMLLVNSTILNQIPKKRLILRFKQKTYIKRIKTFIKKCG